MIEKRDILFTPANEMRTLHIYLPDDYGMSGERYPVMYFFDGHNLFFDGDATYGKSWGLKDFLDHWGKKLIIVGVTCSMTNRLVEYCPYHFTKGFLGEIRGTGDATIRWMLDELKPVIDRDYRTIPFRECTAIGGSSMGGLMSLFAVSAYNSVFSKAACLSPSVRFCMEDMLADIAAAAPMRDTRVYVSWGENETTTKAGLARYTNNAMCVVRALLAAGAQVYPYFQPEGAHCEADWCKQNPLYFDFLFGEG